MSRYVFAATAVILIACAGGGPVPDDAAGQFARAKSLYDRGKYSQAVEALENFTFIHRGSEWVDDAQFYLAMSYYMDRQYASAAAEFARFLNSYASSDLSDDAQYRLALCEVEQSGRWDRDQARTFRALDEFEVLLDVYPASDRVDSARVYVERLRARLGRRAYEVGRTYQRMGRDSSAVISFDEVRGSYGDTEWGLSAVYQMAESYRRLRNFDAARELYETVLIDAPTSPYRRDAALVDKAREGLSQLPPEGAGG